MSLEATIQENTAAILALIETLKSGTPTTAAQVAAVAKEAAAPAGKPKATPAATANPAPTQPTAEAVAAAAPAKKAEASATTPPAAASAASPATPKAEAPSYQDAATAITKLSRTKGRDTAVALLAKFGAANLKEVKPEQFADVIAAADEAMGA